VYIQSSHDIVVHSLVFALYIYSLTLGYACLQVSCTSHFRWTFLRASEAGWSLSLGGLLSRGSSITLKLLIMNSGWAILW
jgi:hypothetical protein